jgi:hypothetical protein
MSQTELVPIDLPEMIGEVRRELNYRQRAYPQWVSEGKLNSRMAARQIDRMEAVLNLLIDLNGPSRPQARRAA